MSLSRHSEIEDTGSRRDCQKTRSHSAQGLTNNQSSPAMKIPLPPSMWITDFEDESSDISDCDNNALAIERHRVRSRFRYYKQRNINVPLGIFWDIENCQVPHGCSAIDVVAAIRNKFLVGRREADFVVVCDVRKETPARLQELNDAQVSLIHVCGTQKNAADEKLRQCMRRFGELHAAPAALLLISGDINFAADLSDFRHRKNMEVILVHKQNTSSALIACASSHYCYNKLTADLPRNPKVKNQIEEEPSCEVEVSNLPTDQPPERVSRRLRRLADNCGGKVQKVKASTAIVKFPTTDQASRALKRMNGEDVFGRKISVRYLRSAYSSDEGYSTAPTAPPPQRLYQTQTQSESSVGSWSLALQALPAPPPPPLDFCPPPAPRPRQIRGAHGSANLDQSACSSASGSNVRYSPWHSSSFSEVSEPDCETAELTVANLPPFEPASLQSMLTELFNQFVRVNRVSVWAASDGPAATVECRSEWDARIAIAKLHKRRLDNAWAGKRLELSLGRPSPVPNLDVLRARLRAIFLDQKSQTMPLLRLRDAYASRHCCALTTSDLAKVKDTVVIHEKFGRMVQLIDLTPVSEADLEEAPWKCHVHAGMNSGQEDGSRILQLVHMEIAVLERNVKVVLDNHGGLLPLLTFVECYEATFPPFPLDPQRGVCLELLLRSVPGVEIKDSPSRHLVYSEREKRMDSPNSVAHSDYETRSSSERGRTAPALEPMLMLFERELIDLLRSAPSCCIPFNKLIPAFHRHFGRQCRVADYGFTKLPDLLAALHNTIVVLGSGSSRIITISASAQSRRWTSDLVKLLSSQPGRAISPHDLPQLYESTFSQPFSPANYGVCTFSELMQKVPSQAVEISPEGLISLPRRTPTLEERERTNQFAAEVIELLGHTPNFRMEFSKFVPAYHAHFGRQLRVAHYGCVKLFELFELIPDAVSISFESRGERCVKLTPKAAGALLTRRLQQLVPLPLSALTWQYAAHFGAPPQPDVLNVASLECLVISMGFNIQNGMIYAPDDSPYRATLALFACSVLCSDRCVARGSAEDYFISSFKKLQGSGPDLAFLVSSGVIEIVDNRVTLTPTWRTVWRVARLLVDRAPMTAMEIYVEYTNNYEPFLLCAAQGLEGVAEFLRQHRQVFVEETSGRFALCVGVAVPRCRAAHKSEDYSIYDTPPGQKGSRVFESPKTNLWSSPPASALPLPSALLAQENRRRTRLAAQFDAN